MNTMQAIKSENAFDTLERGNEWKVRYIADLKTILKYLGKDLTGKTITASEAHHMALLLIISLKSEILRLRKIIDGEEESLFRLRSTNELPLPKTRANPGTKR